MISTGDIVITICVSLIYLLIIPFQLIIFPMKYYSVKDIIYSSNIKKAKGAFVSRFVFILLICWILWILNKRNSVAVCGVTIGSFLCAWPSIYHYQLFACIKNKYKTLYLIACIVSVFFSWACAAFSMDILLPMIYEGKPFYLFDNNGLQILFEILSLLLPFGMRRIIKEEEQDNPYLVSDTLYADMYLTTRKIQFEEPFFSQYSYEIEEAAKKFRISPELLSIVIKLEKINRGAWRNRLSEQLAVRIIPKLLIRRNVTLGLAQISIKNAHGYFHVAPQRYIRDMLKPEISIELCAFVLRDLLDEYQSYWPSDDDPFYDIYESKDESDNYKCALYIASNYICGANDVLKKYTLVYAQLIDDNAPVLFPGNG